MSKNVKTPPIYALLDGRLVSYHDDGKCVWQITDGVKPSTSAIRIPELDLPSQPTQLFFVYANSRHVVCAVCAEGVFNVLPQEKRVERSLYNADVDEATRVMIRAQAALVEDELRDAERELDQQNAIREAQLAAAEAAKKSIATMAERRKAVSQQHRELLAKAGDLTPAQLAELKNEIVAIRGKAHE